MKAVVQRTTEAKVTAEGKEPRRVDKGLVVLLGVSREDTEEDALYLAKKIPHLRIFEDENEKMNYSAVDVEGEILSISQFTLFGDTRKGRRPNFMQAAKPDMANDLYEKFNAYVRREGIPVVTGSFGEMMQVDLVNDGPVTLILDSKER
ncbi:D-aminoacyl-tRNA deacylase [Salimicrobium salexigens]|uniref:D-aminoacyl-tRNA deacylase n=1 Tax=Salimicrobium salexigens TaxID=908941 RepID=A0ABY1KMW4_9BACI|nr:D-aminoacyl-tRNA deacylase [Salimicrobium salexigens]SIS51302.1 D-tyrosyl-tRNA(Tyr) deacylase [Salimicrobium salexigens]